MNHDLSLFTAHGLELEPAQAGSPGAVVLSAGEGLCFVHTDDTAIVRDLLDKRYIVVDVENLMQTNVTLSLFFWRAGSDIDHPDMYITLGLFPGLRTRIGLDHDHLDGQQLFLDRTPGKLKSMARGAGIDPDEVSRFGLGIMRSEPGAKLRITALWSQDEAPEYPLPDTKVVDELGQWKTAQWPGKTRSLDELTAYLREEVQKADASPQQHPGVSPWGGIVRAAGSGTPAPFSGTGYFRVQHDGNRFFLVDPDGYPFYSLGLDCVREEIDARVDGIEKLFDWLPPADGEFGEFWIDGSRRFSGARLFDFLGANMKRALGPDWFARWAGLTEQRMKQWRFNTIGNWSSPRFIEASGLPYVVPLSGSIGTATSIFRDFPDVFSDEFARASEQHAEQLDRFAGDRRLLGYFIMNEPHWAFEQNLNVAEKLLANPAELASKEALLSFLSERYSGDARKLAAAWNLDDVSSFADLYAPRVNAASLSTTAAADLDAFNTVLIKRFARLPCEAAKRADPHHLNLGMRYAWISQPALYETGEYFDVFSINRYAPTAREAVDEIGERSGKPVMIGEFHHGGLDAGLPSNGIRGVRTQAERAQAYRYFVETTAASPWSVGVHYFTLNDQAILGRFDGENFQIGLVDTCQRPYDDFVAGVEDTNRRLPEVLYADRAPTDYYPPEVTVGF